MGIALGFKLMVYVKCESEKGPVPFRLPKLQPPCGPPPPFPVEGSQPKIDPGWKVQDLVLQTPSCKVEPLKLCWEDCPEAELVFR